MITCEMIGDIHHCRCSGRIDSEQLTDHVQEIVSQGPNQVKEFVEFTEDAEIDMTMMELREVMTQIVKAIRKSDAKFTIIYVRPQSLEVLPYINYILSSTNILGEMTWMAESAREAQEILESMPSA